jgi:ArsR family transcriptional regulator
VNSIDIALICRALGDSNRLQIVQTLAGGEQCACRLLEQFNITQPTLSHHMKILCASGLVNVRKEGRWSHYSLACDTLDELKRFFEALDCHGEEGGCSCL